MHTQLKTYMTAGITALALLAGAVSADSPDRKNKMSGEEVWRLYAGKTWVWSKGGSYWGGDSSFEAVWDGAVGVGKWYATSTGKLCYEASWKREAADDPANVTRCWEHVKDTKGRIWKKDPQTSDWYRAAKELEERLVKGNKIKSDVRQLRRKAQL